MRSYITLGIAHTPYSEESVAMAENKMKPNAASVETYLAAIENPVRRTDCETLVNFMTKATKQPPKMWGTAIVGFGTHKYPLAGGREGETCLMGFSSRKGGISIYGTASPPKRDELLTRLGKHKTGRGCLYIAKLSDVDTKILEQIFAGAVKAKVV